MTGAAALDPAMQLKPRAKPLPRALTPPPRNGTLEAAEPPPRPAPPSPAVIAAQEAIAAQHPGEFVVLVGVRVFGVTREEDDAYDLVDAAWREEPAVEPVLFRPSSAPDRPFPPAVRSRATVWRARG